MSLSPSTPLIEFEASESALGFDGSDDEPSIFSPDRHHPPSPGQRASVMSITSLCSPLVYFPHEARLAQIPSVFYAQHPPTMSNEARTQLGHTLATTDYRSPLPAGPADEDAYLGSPAFAPTSRKRRRDCNAQPPMLPAGEFDEHTKTWKHATGFRRDLTADKLTIPDAPTRKKRPSTTFPRRRDVAADKLTQPNAPIRKKRPSATFPRRTAAPAAARNGGDLTKPLAVSSSQNSGSDESANEEGDEPREAVNVGTSSRRADIRMDRMKYWGDIDGGATMIDLDLEEGVRLEKKRRQNTQAARRSRIRKAEEVQKLQSRVAELEAEVIAGRHRLAQATRLGGAFVCCEGAVCCRCFGTRRAFTAHPNGVCILQPRDYAAFLGTPNVAIAPSYVPTVPPVLDGERNISGHPPYVHPHCIGCVGPHGARAHDCLAGREVLGIPHMRAGHQRSSLEDRANLTIPTTRDRSHSDSEGSSRSASPRRK